MYILCMDTMDIMIISEIAFLQKQWTNLEMNTAVYPNGSSSFCIRVFLASGF